jgi:hypothetical protein
MDPLAEKMPEKAYEYSIWGKTYIPLKVWRYRPPTIHSGNTILSHSAIIVLLIIMDFCGSTYHCVVKRSLLAQKANLKTRQLNNILDELKRKEFIDIVYRGKEGNEYYLVYHPLYGRLNEKWVKGEELGALHCLRERNRVRYERTQAEYCAPEIPDLESLLRTI